MGKKKTQKVSFPKMEAMLEGMQELLTDEHGNPLPSDHPQVLKLKNLAQHIGNSMEGGEGLDLLHGHA